MRKQLTLLLMLTTIVLVSPRLFSSVPHPRLVERIKKGEIPEPYYLRHLSELRARGVNAPWSSRELELRRQMPGGLLQRSLGAARVPTGTWKALLILVQFSDKPQQVAATSFDTLIFGNRSGTLRDYFGAVSYGTLQIVTVNLPSSIGWQTAPQTYAYYVNGQNGLGMYPHNSQKLVEDVAALVDPVVDFSQYDNDHDGYVDALFIVHAGPGAEFTGNNDDIWSHAWVTNTRQLHDGVYVYRYSVEPEYWVSPGDMTIGVYCHELGHALFGLPDLYDTDYSSAGLGGWSLMAGGSWNGATGFGESPAFPDVWSHFQMGYVTPTNIVSNVVGQTVSAIETHAQAYRLWRNGSVESQYFLVENRQKIGYDAYLPGAGLLIYHVDESVTTGNDDEWYPGHTSGGHYLVALEQADGLYELEKSMNWGDAGDPYPGNTNNTSFYWGSRPNSWDYTFAMTGVGVRNISAPSGTMTADMEIVANDSGVVVVSPNGGEGWEVGETHQIAWNSLNIDSVNIEYSTDDGSSWLPIGNLPASPQRPGTAISAADAISQAGTPTRAFAKGVATYPDAEVSVALLSIPGEQNAAHLGAYEWTVPNTPSTQCRVRVSDLHNASRHDESDSPFSILSVVPGLWNVQFNYDATAVTGAAGNAGAVFIPTLNEFWTSRWASNVLHRWTARGRLIEQFSIPGVSGVRGMTFDGHYIYAGINTSTIQVIDPVTRTAVGTISAPLPVRFITYDPTADGGAGGFWVGNWTTDVVLISRSGAVLRTLPYYTLGSTSNYGAAFDMYSEGGPYLWLWGQGTGSGPQEIVQVSVSTGLPTGRRHDVLTDVGVTGGIAGGLFISTGIVPWAVTIGGLLQGTPDRLFGYQLKALSPGVMVASPNGGEYLRIGSVRNVTWLSNLVTDVKIEYSTDGGSSWSTVVASTPASNYSYPWTIPNTPSTQCKVRISDASNGSLFDESDSLFTIGVKPTTEIEPNNTMAQANEIEYGDSLDAAIRPMGDVDYYKFNALAGDTVDIFTYNRGSSSLDGAILLMDSLGNWLAENDDYGSTSQSRLEYQIQNSGTYYIRYAYYANYSGVSVPRENHKPDWVGEGDRRGLLSKQAKQPNLAPYDSGDYRISLKRFTPSAPVVSWGYVYNVFYNAVNFYAPVYPNGLSTDVRFDYGTTTGYGSSVTAVNSPINGIGEWYAFTDKITGLSPNTIYHFRVVATNRLGTAYGPDRVFVTPASPTGWSVQSSGTTTRLESVNFVSGYVGWVAGLNGTILKTTNGGVDWLSLVSGTWENLFSISFADTNNGFAVGESGTILKTSNGGSNWVKLNSGVGSRLMSVHCLSSTIAYAAGESNGVGESVILKTTDGGGTWTTLVTMPAVISLESVHFSDPTTGYVVGSDGTIFRTTDGGATWVGQRSGTTQWLTDVSSTDANTATAVGSGGTILRTTNGGVTWVSQSSGTTNWLYGVSFTDANNGAAVGDYGTILRTTNGGVTWVSQSSGTTNTLRGVSFTDANNGAAVGSYGTILRTVSPSPPPASWNFTSNTNSNATIVVPTAINPPLQPGDAVGVFFVRNDSLICAGYSIWQGANMAITAWGDDSQSPLKDGFAEGELIRYKIWDAQARREYSATVTYQSGGTTYVTNGMYVLSSLVKITTFSHNVALSQRWNMISSYIQPVDSTLDSLCARIKAHLVMMKNGMGQVYWPAYGINTIGNWNYRNGYQVYMQSPDTLVVTGTAVAPEATPVPLIQRWNLVAYLRDSPMRCDSALASIASYLVIAKNGMGQVYWPAYGINTIGSMIPGQGYQMYLTQAGTLTYPANSAPASRLAKQHEVAEVKDVTSPMHYRLAVSNTGANATLLVESPQLKDGDEIGVWTAKKLLVGSGVITQGRAVLVVWADNSMTEDITEGAVDGEMLTLTVWSNGEQSERALVISSLVDALTGEQIRDGLHYKTDAVWIARAGRAESQELPTVFSLSQNYPNPFNPSTVIRYGIPRDSKVTLEVYNVLGQRVSVLVNEMQKAGYHEVVFQDNDLSSGVYFYRLQADTFSETRKLILLR